MLLKTKRDVILKPLLLTTGFVEKKQTLPILSNVYIKKHGGNLTVIANDMEIQASVTSTGEMHGEDFIVTLPGKMLENVLKTFSDEALISFALKDNKMQIKSGNSKFMLQSMPADHYPLLQIRGDCIGQFDINQKELKTLISQVQYAMAINDARVFLNGVYFEIKDNQLRLVATDAHRLGFAASPLSDIIADMSAILPRKTVLELYKLLDDTENPITIKIYPSQVVFETAGKQLISKVIDGKYPSYDRVIPTNNDKLALIKREELLRAVQRVSVIGDKVKTVTIDISHNKLSISYVNEHQEESNDEIEVQYGYEAADLKLNFNINYVLDLLNNCHSELLQWAFFDNSRSALVTIPNEINFKAVIMPLRN